MIQPEKNTITIAHMDTLKHKNQTDQTNKRRAPTTFTLNDDPKLKIKIKQ